MWQSRQVPFLPGCGFSAWAERPDGKLPDGSLYSSNAGFTGRIRQFQVTCDYDYWILEFDTNGVIIAGEILVTGSDILSRSICIPGSGRDQ